MKKILVIEDDQFLVEIYGQKLKEAGFEVDFAFDGEEALKKLKEDSISLLLLDLVLPKMTGFEILREIKKEEKYKNLKIVVLSNLGEKEEIKKGLSLGADRYFIKSHYTPVEIVKEIEKMLE